MGDVYQGPAYELRFISKSELDMHHQLDHSAKEPEESPPYDDEEE